MTICSDEPEEVAPQAPPRRVAARVGGTRRNRTMRAQVEYARRMRGEVIDEEDEDDEEEYGNDAGFEDEDEMDEERLSSGKMGTKKLRKLQAKAEKKAMREQEEALREDKKRRDALREEERKKADEQQKKLEEKKAEEERKAKEERERKEHEEYLKLKEAFTVDEEGEKELETEENSQALLQEFIDYIKTNKVVQLESLASQFNLRTQEAIDRIHDLQEMGRLTGVVDDRGKFIFISQEELEAFALFIKQRGRVSIQELASSSSMLINFSNSTSNTVN
jgi:hypothetical protein